MNRLSKVVLINWMYFQKTSFQIDGNAAIVGVNGTGKSTIIDAIQMLLLGNKSSRFNANANAEKRTLESYVRGAINTMDKEYLRNGDVITYLALELELNGVKNILGININYKFERQELSDPKYFLISDMALDEDMFVKDNYPKTFDTFSKEFHPQFFATLSAYQNKLKDLLGLKDAKKYFQTLSRAVGIKNITNCNDFMTEFVLDENPIDVLSIKKGIIDMEKVNKTIELERKKLEALQEIEAKGDIISICIDSLENDEIKVNLADIILKNEEIARLDLNNRDLNNKIKETEDLKNNLNEEIKALNLSKVEVTNSINQISPLLNRKVEELDSLNEKYNKVHVDYNTFITRLKNEISSIKRLNTKEGDALISYLDEEAITSARTRSLLEDFRNECATLATNCNLEILKLKSEISVVRDKLAELNDIINRLNSNKYTFNPKLDEFKDYIKKSLEDKYHEDIEVKFLCEYLEIDEEHSDWQKAIEGYLNTQRFYLVVPNRYYKDALKLYDKRKDFCLTRIINGNRIPEMDYEENTLGAYVLSSNIVALNYARYILNRVACAKDIYDLENYDIAVTKDCMHYQSYSVGRLNIRATEELYIGKNGIKAQLLKRKKDYEALSNDANRLKDDYLKYSDKYNALDSEIKFVNLLLESPNLILSIDEDERLYNRINKLEEDINFYKSNPQYIELSSRLEEININIIDASKKYNDLINNLVDLGSSIKKNEANIIVIKDKIDYINSLLALKDSDIVDYNKEEISKEIVNQGYLVNLNNDIKRLKTSIIKDKTEISNMMKNARDTFSINLEPTFESLDGFKNELFKVDQTMFRYQSKLVDLKKNNRKLFFSQFLAKLYKEIEKAKDEIDNLNNSLSIFDFGNDHYKIKMNITDNTDLKEIYLYAEKYNSDDSNRGLFIDRDIKDIDDGKVEAILNEYLFSNDVNLNNMIVDYRKYLVFDVLAYTPNGVKSLNKVMRTQSGGEVQVPFYILSGVAFQQTLDYKRNKDALGIVLYDEAFDKMDSQRIDSMLRFYRDKLNLQLVLATPGKLDSLVDNIETIIAVIRDGDNAIVSDISYEL